MNLKTTNKKVHINILFVNEKTAINKNNNWISV